MARESTLRFGAQTDEMTSLLRIVNMVRTGDAATRPEIGRVTGLGRGVVTQRVDHAIEMGYLVDGEFGPSSGGRAPRTLRFRGDAGRIVVCALGALHIHVGVSLLDGDVIDHEHSTWDIARGPAETLEKAQGMIDAVLARTPDVPVWGIGVGVPGPVDFDSGRPVAPPIMPGWNGFDVRKRFEQRYDAPVWVDNDVNLLTLGERARRGDDHLDLIYCKIGSGIGAGLLSHGHIHRGANGAAGDIGHVRVRDSEALCRCGKVGCLEAVAGGWALIRDALAIRLIQRSARIVGESIAALVNMFNPATIVIGGAVAAAGELFLAEVRQRVYELSLPLATRDLAIVNSQNDVREPLRGGVEMVREQLFDVTFPRWFAVGQPTIRAIRGVVEAAA
jgi:predicted NBD/HSP70 family sugar kinase